MTLPDRTLPARLRAGPGAGRRSLVLLAVTTGLGLLHHADHVLRVDHSGWPFLPRVTPFTASLLVYPVVYAAYRARTRPAVAAGLVGLVFVLLQAAHTFIETPRHQYDVWATGVSHLPETPGQPNLLHVASPALGAASVTLSLLLSVAALSATLSLAADARVRHRPGR